MAEDFNSKGIILISREYKDSDRMLSVLTADRGLITICAKGVQKPGSSNAFVSIPYSLCEFSVSVSHGFNYLKDGSIVESNSSIMKSIEAMTVASHIAECLIDAALPVEDSRQLYELAVYAFYVLANSPDRFFVVYNAFNWRILTIAGQTIEYVVTNDTQNEIEDNKTYYLSLKGGEIYEKKENSRTNISMSSNAIYALNFFANCEISELYAVKCSDNVLRQLTNFTTAYLSVQFDKQYEALLMFEQLGVISD